MTEEQLKSDASAAASGTAQRIDEIERWFESRDLPFTSKMNQWLSDHGIKNKEMMKLVKMEQWEEVLLDPNDQGTLLYRNGSAFTAFQTHFQLLTSDGERLFESKAWCRYVLSALLSYVILVIFVTSTARYVYIFEKHDCFPNKSRNITNDDALMCDYLKDDQILIGAHNVTFGLVSAVVVSQLVAAAGNERSGLYAKFAPLLESRKEKRRRWYDRAFEHIILQTTRVYVLTWIVVGSFCLIYGIVRPVEENSIGPIFTTGQTWLGIAVTQTYAFFGAERAVEKEGEKENPSAQSNGVTPTDTTSSNDTVVSNSVGAAGADEKQVSAQEHSSSRTLYSDGDHIDEEEGKRE